MEVEGSVTSKASHKERLPSSKIQLDTAWPLRATSKQRSSLQNPKAHILNARKAYLGSICTEENWRDSRSISSQKLLPGGARICAGVEDLARELWMFPEAASTGPSETRCKGDTPSKTGLTYIAQNVGWECPASGPGYGPPDYPQPLQELGI